MNTYPGPSAKDQPQIKASALSVAGDGLAGSGALASGAQAETFDFNALAGGSQARDGGDRHLHLQIVKQGIPAWFDTTFINADGGGPEPSMASADSGSHGLDLLPSEWWADETPQQHLVGFHAPKVLEMSL